MKFVRKNSTYITSLTSAVLLAVLISSCSQTAAPQPNIIQRVEGEQATPPPPSGFLGSDYTLLKPPAEGSGQTAMLVYTNPSVNFSSYTKVIIAPVTFWANDDSKVSAADQQTLCNYMYNLLTEEFSKNFTVVNEPGPGVAKLTGAISDATSATPGLRTISIIVPQAHALNLIKAGLTGTYAFVGSATGEAKLTDSVSGQLLAAWADQRFGTAAVSNATVFQWGDAENVMTAWAKGLDQRLVTLGIQNTGPLAAN
jgi:Protein of unknown function (DUF3313)